MQTMIIDDIKSIDKKKFIEDVFVKKMGLNPIFSGFSSFIHEIFSRYVSFDDGRNVYFSGDSIISSSDVPGESSYTLTITDDGNLKVSYLSLSISRDKEWPQYFKDCIEIIYLPKDNGYQEIKKTSHLYKGMARTPSNPEGEMISQLTSIDFVMRDFEDNIEMRRLSLTKVFDKSCDVEDYSMPPLSYYDKVLLGCIPKLLTTCKKMSLEEIQHSLEENGFYGFSALIRDSLFKEKGVHRQVTLDNGYSSAEYNLRIDSLNHLFVSHNADLWSGGWSSQKLEKAIMESTFVGRVGKMSLPYDYDVIDMFLSLLNSFVGRIDYPEMKKDLESKIAEAEKYTADVVFTYDIEDGQLVKRQDVKELGKI